MQSIALIGFGEAGRAFAEGWAGNARAVAFDIKTSDPATAAAKRAEYAQAGVIGCATLAEALAEATAILSLVTADQVTAATRAATSHLVHDALWLDMNSVAPDTKRAAARIVEAAGGRYVDVAVMAPVHPARRAVPLLLSGEHAAAGAEMLRSMGFTDERIVAGGIGAASSIKMIRSVMVKGLEALCAEAMLAAEAAGVTTEVIASLDASWPGAAWRARADYNLDRMMVHGMRRAAEMEEVVKTLESLGTGAAMTRGTVERQRAIGAMSLAPPEGLTAKLAALTARFKPAPSLPFPHESPACAGATE